MNRLNVILLLGMILLFTSEVEIINATSHAVYDANYMNPASGNRLPAFPGAEGFGRYAAGGRGGKVY